MNTTKDPAASVEDSSQLSISPKIQGRHQSRMAVVYVRQSSLQQVMDHRESRARQYALADYARQLGWASDQVLVIDEDQGQSGSTSEQRSGFQRVLGEVTMDHVGIVLSLEMSRLARSSKDWHHLLEVCALFGSLLGDQDGIYDPIDANDRLLLGLKGTMSEVELFTMRNRLERGRLFKAERGELFGDLPVGYVKLPNGDVELEPDEQARAVVHLLFDKFDELGTVYGVFRYLMRNGIKIGRRERSGPQRGELVWRKPSVPGLTQTFRHPFYAGAYAYGRETYDPKHRAIHGGRTGQYRRPMSEWRVLLRDRLPAYITWERYLANLERLRNNRTSPDSPGPARSGSALLSGIVVCGACGRRLSTQYKQGRDAPYYLCSQGYYAGDAETCCGLSGKVLDELVAQQVLRALEPASIELSLQASQAMHQERERLHQHWRRQLERVAYDVQRAERRYRAVEPENRLVARSLEKSWEEALRKQRQTEAEQERFLHHQPADLSAEELQRIESLATDIPGVWSATTTSNLDRKEIVRCLVERVVVAMTKDSELVDVTIHWQGGSTSQHHVVRPLLRYDQHRDYEALLQRVVALRRSGLDTDRIAKQLDAEGFRPPKRREGFTGQIVRKLFLRAGIGDDRKEPDALQPGEWWLCDLAKHLAVDSHKLRLWAKRGWVHGRRTAVQRYWVLWADDGELRRLLQLVDVSQKGTCRYSTQLTTPAQRQS